MTDIRIVELPYLLTLTCERAEVRPGAWLQVERSRFPGEWFLTVGPWFLSFRLPMVSVLAGGVRG